MRKLLTTALALALLTGAAACGGDDDTAGDDTTGTTAASGDTTDSTTGDARIDELIQRSREATFQVTYETGDGDELVVAQDPPRYAFVSGDSGTYQTSDGEVVGCSGIDDPDTAECTTLPLAGDFLTQGITTLFGAGFAAIVVAADAGNDIFGTIELHDEQIIGRDAKCATFDPGNAPFVPDDSGSWEVCVDDETGAVLRSVATDADGNRAQVIEATDFGEPDDAVLDPPAPPVEITIPSLPGGITIPTVPGA